MSFVVPYVNVNIVVTASNDDSRIEIWRYERVGVNKARETKQGAKWKSREKTKKTWQIKWEAKRERENENSRKSIQLRKPNRSWPLVSPSVSSFTSFCHLYWTLIFLANTSFQFLHLFRVYLLHMVATAQSNNSAHVLGFGFCFFPISVLSFVDGLFIVPLIVDWFLLRV